MTNDDIKEIKKKIKKLSQNPKDNYYELLNIYKNLITLYYEMKKNNN
jgi:hypothetical protein